MRRDPCECHGGSGHIDVHISSGLMPRPAVSGDRRKVRVSASATVYKGEFVQRVFEYVAKGDRLRWGQEDVRILDAAELSKGRVGVVFTQSGQTKFKVLALADGVLALGNTLVLVEDEAVEEAALLELADGRALVAYNQDAAGVAALIGLDGRTAVLAGTDIWDEYDPVNICASRIIDGSVLLSGVRQSYAHSGEAWVTCLNLASFGTTSGLPYHSVKVEGGHDTDAYAGGWSLVQVSEGSAVLCFPQALDKPVGFAVIDVGPGMWTDDRMQVRCVGSGKYAASLPTIQAAQLDGGRWLMAYGIGWLSPNKQVVKSALALEVWGLTRYAAELLWYGCDDARYAEGLGGVSAAPNGLGAAITYTGEQEARVAHLGVVGTPYAGPGISLGAHAGFCRVVPISVNKALLVVQDGGNGYVQLMEVEERVIPSDVLIHGVAITGGGPGEEITITEKAAD